MGSAGRTIFNDAALLFNKPAGIDLLLRETDVHHDPSRSVRVLAQGYRAFVPRAATRTLKPLVAVALGQAQPVQGRNLCRGRPLAEDRVAKLARSVRPPRPTRECATMSNRLCARRELGLCSVTVQ